MQGGDPNELARRGTRLATPTIDARVERLERRAESDDTTLQSILLILERVDQRLVALEADIAELKSVTSSLKTDVNSAKADVATVRSAVVEIAGNARDRDSVEYPLLRLPPSVDRRRPFAFRR